MPSYCIRIRRPGEHSWQFLAPQYVVTDNRAYAQLFDDEANAMRWLPIIARRFPDRELRAAEIGAYVIG